MSNCEKLGRSCASCSGCAAPISAETATNKHKTFFDQYAEFADAAGVHRGTLSEEPHYAFAELALRLVDEEVNKELFPALEEYLKVPSVGAAAQVLDGIVDSIYVLCQLGYTLGLPVNEGWAEIHRSNMAKIAIDDLGKAVVKRREDGKILKPEGWKRPDVEGVIMNAKWKEVYK